jgi:hypothetical protein
MKVFPGMHYTMGGLGVNGVDQATNIAGIYTAGECEYQYHGANRLGANSLVSCIFGIEQPLWGASGLKIGWSGAPTFLTPEGSHPQPN